MRIVPDPFLKHEAAVKGKALVCVGCGKVLVYGDNRPGAWYENRKTGDVHRSEKGKIPKSVSYCQGDGDGR